LDDIGRLYAAEC